MTQKTIRHGIFTWLDSEGTNHIAFHGQTVEIDNKDEVLRGEREGAFFEQVGQEADRVGTLPSLPPEPTDEQMRSWIVAGTAPEVLAQAKTYPPSVIARLAVLEEERIGARENLVAGLRELAQIGGAYLDDEPETPTPDDEPEDAEPQGDEPEGANDDLAAFVESANIPAIVEKAGDDPELAKALREAEEARSDPRKSLIEKLSQIEG